MVELPSAEEELSCYIVGIRSLVLEHGGQYCCSQMMGSVGMEPSAIPVSSRVEGIRMYQEAESRSLLFDSWFATCK